MFQKENRVRNSLPKTRWGCWNSERVVIRTLAHEPGFELAEKEFLILLQRILSDTGLSDSETITGVVDEATSP